MWNDNIILYYNESELNRATCVSMDGAHNHDDEQKKAKTSCTRMPKIFLI